MNNMQPERNSMWLKRALNQVGRAVFVCMIIALYTWMSHCAESKSSNLSMRVTRSMGPESELSRCGDCPQIGDTYTIVVWGVVPPDNSSIYVFSSSDNRIVVSCDDCTILTFVVNTIGKFDVIGASYRCPIDKRSLDSLILSVQRCGVYEHSTYQIR